MQSMALDLSWRAVAMWLDNTVVHLMSQRYDAEELADLQRMTADEGDDTGSDLDRLPAGDDEATRQELAGRVATSPRSP